MAPSRRRPARRALAERRRAFNPFSRTPLFLVGYEFGDFSVDLAAIWQMQYTSAGPDGASADYIKYGKTPEIYLGF